VNPCRIRAEDLGVLFGRESWTLDAINLDIDPGAFVALVGPSGCGKSTLLRCLAGLQQPSRGQLTIETTDRRSPQRAYVFQDANLLHWRSARENVTLPLELAGSAAANRESAAARALQTAGLLAADFSKRPGMLSGGMRMRVSLARALVTEPDLMLLDEPFAALDDLSRQQLNDELIGLWEAEGWTTVFVTHNVAEAVYLSQRVLVMTRKPARIVADIAVPLAYPRTHQTRVAPEFVQLCAQVSEQLRSAAA
jgi:NitT/TauT family transport system ATP-binding protein